MSVGTRPTTNTQRYTHEGGCHCGHVRWTLESGLAAAKLPARACQCAFCQKVGALSTSDPAGRLRFVLREPETVLRYRFGTRTADFLTCVRCGTYVGAVTEHEGRRYGIVNLNTFDGRAGLSITHQPMDYSREDAPTRRTRRVARWTPIDER